MSIARLLLIRLDPFVERSAITGSLRRGLPDCGDVDILIVPAHRTPHPDYITNVMRTLSANGRLDINGDDLIIADMRLPDGRLIPVNVFMTSPENWGAALHYTTGSRAYNVIVRWWAKKRGMRADQYGVWRDKRLIPYSGESEETYCRTIGIPWIPPEARTGEGHSVLAPRYRKG